jgi:acetyl esterase/lipase
MLVMLVVAAIIAVRPLTQFTHVAATASAQLGTEAGTPRFSLITAVRGLPTSANVVERTFHYAAPDLQRLSLRLFSQTPVANRPTVVVIYGGAWRNGSPSQCENVSRALASKGFTVVAIDYRHVPLSRFPAQIDDVNRALLILRDSSDAWGIDLNRVAILGRSSGGHLAELAAFTPNEFHIKAVVALYAPYDLAEGYADLPSPDPMGVRYVLTGFLNGTPEQQPRRYLAASPSTLVRPGLPPTLLVFGTRDHIVKAAFNREAAAALRAAKVPVVSVEIPWAEHGFDMAPAGLGAQLAFSVIVDFLDRELKKEPQPR